jgi:hypothetical protein
VGSGIADMLGTEGVTRQANTPPPLRIYDSDPKEVTFGLSDRPMHQWQKKAGS